MFRRFVMTSFAAATLVVGLTGCAPERHPAIPDDAKLVAESERGATYTTPSAGHIYIFDQTDNKLIDSRPVGSGKTVMVDAATNRVTVDGNLVTDKVTPGHRTRIFFRPSDTAMDSVETGRRRSNTLDEHPMDREYDRDRY